jgi:hypothetical protein
MQEHSLEEMHKKIHSITNVSELAEYLKIVLHAHTEILNLPMEASTNSRKH